MAVQLTEIPTKHFINGMLSSTTCSARVSRISVSVISSQRESKFARCSAWETVISQDVNEKLCEKVGKGKGRRGGVATTGLIEIDAVESYGFLSGSYSRLSEKERERIARQSSLPGCL